MPVQHVSAAGYRVRLRLTEQEFLAIPAKAYKPYLEFMDGVALQKTGGDVNHSRLAGEFDGRFWLYQREFGGDLGIEGRVRLRPALYLLPDVAYWPPGRPCGADSIPSVAVEVISPDDALNDTRAKCRLYREYGVDVAWLVDPFRRVVEVFDDTHDGAELAIGGVLTAAVMPGFSLPLAELFAVLDRSR